MSSKLKVKKVFNDTFTLDVSKFIDCTVYASRKGIAEWCMIGTGKGNKNTGAMARFTLKCDFDPQIDYLIAVVSKGEQCTAQAILITGKRPVWPVLSTCGKKNPADHGAYRLTHKDCALKNCAQANCCGA